MPEPHKSAETKYDTGAQIVQMLANVAIVLGIVFAIAQLLQTRHIESIRLAVDATSPAGTREFLASYGKLVDAYHEDRDMLNTDSLRDDVSFVLTVYDNIAILYLHNLADRNIVEARVHDGMSQLIPILDAKKWPIEARSNLDAALTLMATQHRKRQTTNIRPETHKK